MDCIGAGYNKVVYERVALVVVVLAELLNKLRIVLRLALSNEQP
jgi:hypothetical protein